ncbi:MAG: serine hydrolase domain-containing protein [bacterium]|nr:serine hydrolase domain-containing protein [bacterium]
MNKVKNQELNQRMKECGFSGLVSIEQHQKVIYQYINGMADRDKKQSINRETLFAVASGTKFLTALAIGRLVDQLKCSLDTKAQDIYDLHLASMNPNITIKQLLSHTSGMSDYLDEDELDDTKPIYFDVPYKDLVNPKDFIPIFSKKKAKFLPGEKFNYNNQAYVYLAIIIEELSNQSYKDFINDQILRPLQIERSGIKHLTDYPPHTAIGYLSQKENSLTNIGLLPFQSGGDGGAVFSIDDMKKIWEAFFDYKIVSKSMVDQFISIHAVEDENSGSYYGLGMWLKKQGNILVPYLFGGDPGISFVSSYQPTTKKFLFAVSNTSTGVWDIYDDINNIYKNM